ncbi:hypothetical protein PS627_01527 [Pseudomonas fluorescens]|uniref:hypothetical protein n=1 Tax=Pseudomonas fluorescens TaxID=294 RepID=UPI0012575CB1|nr:hypothetical protein [Pseudomonas fluorescens]CAG8865608.1 hypothetical protein PS627_01527 [Pseudomonas fluorescens]
MRVRGTIFWQWSDPTLHHRVHDETMDDGTEIEVQVRLSRVGSTQMFIGVYSPSGAPILEEAFASRPGESMTRALVWGVDHARHIATKGVRTARRAAGGSR